MPCITHSRSCSHGLISEGEHGVVKGTHASKIHMGICRVWRGAYDAHAHDLHGVRTAA